MYSYIAILSCNLRLKYILQFFFLNCSFHILPALRNRQNVSPNDEFLHSVSFQLKVFQGTPEKCVGDMAHLKTFQEGAVETHSIIRKALVTWRELK